MPKLSPPLLWSLLRAEKIVFIGLSPDSYTERDLRHYQAMFPEAEISLAPFMSGTLEIIDLQEESK